MTKQKDDFNLEDFIKEGKFSNNEKKALEKLLSVVNSQDSEMMKKAKEQYTDAFDIIYDSKFSVGTFKIVDAKGNVIARLLTGNDDPTGENVVIVSNQFTKRMN